MPQLQHGMCFLYVTQLSQDVDGPLSNKSKKFCTTFQIEDMSGVQHSFESDT